MRITENEREPFAVHAHFCMVHALIQIDGGKPIESKKSPAILDIAV